MKDEFWSKNWTSNLKSWDSGSICTSAWTHILIQQDVEFVTSSSRNSNLYVINKTIFINIVQTRNETRGDEKVYAAFSWIWCVIYDHSFFCCFYFMDCMFYDFIFWVTIVETDYINNLGAQIISLTRTM